MKPGQQQLLTALLKNLKLPTMVKNYEPFAREARESGVAYERYLLRLVEEERNQRKANQLQRRLRGANFPQMKTLEEADLTRWPGLDAMSLRAYAEGDFIKACQNLIFIGKHGTGKTHAAIALGIEACRQGYRVAFVTAAGLVNQLVEARDEKQLKNTLKRLNKVDLLILDELGYIPFSREGGQLLFQVISGRYESGAMILTSNLAFSEWDKVFGDANLTAALLDRLTHHSHIHQFAWESIRFQESMKKRRESKNQKN